MTDIRNDKLTITLRKPVQSHGETYARLELNEPTVDQLMHWHDLVGIARDIQAVSIVAAIPKGAVNEILARDLLAAARLIHAFSVVVAPTAGAQPDELSIAFNKPIEADGGKFDKIALREPSAAELIEWEKTVLSKQLHWAV